LYRCLYNLEKAFKINIKIAAIAISISKFPVTESNEKINQKVARFSNSKAVNKKIASTCGFTKR